MMHVPEADIVAGGTADALADMGAQASHQMDLSGSDSKLRLEIHGKYWRLIRGELMIFDDPQPRLAAIDELEDFYPGRPSLYHRVLVPVLTRNNLVVSAWVYVSAIGTEDLKPIEADSWECP